MHPAITSAVISGGLGQFKATRRTRPSASAARDFAAGGLISYGPNLERSADLRVAWPKLPRASSTLTALSSGGLENERTTPRATFRRGQLSLQSNEIFWQNEPNSEEIASSCQLRASICCRTRCFSAVFSAGGATTKPAPRAHNSRPRSICSGRVFRFLVLVSQTAITAWSGKFGRLEKQPTFISPHDPWVER
jgi:hypothetical protein